jgi:ferredoxin-thioredoxin reductase catalytic subunit
LNKSQKSARSARKQKSADVRRTVCPCKTSTHKNEVASSWPRVPILKLFNDFRRNFCTVYLHRKFSPEFNFAIILYELKQNVAIFSKNKITVRQNSLERIKIDNFI